MPNEFLSFRLGGEEYGVDILRAQEIRSYEAPTRIANMPDYSRAGKRLHAATVVDRRHRRQVKPGEAVGAR